jgi:hypothetical protein
MTERTLILNFTCPHCDACVGVTVRCTGRKVALEAATATIYVPCPACGRGSEVVFETNGLVRAVRRRGERPLPQPSLN